MLDNGKKDRWLEAEEYIKKTPEKAYYYTLDISKIDGLKQKSML